MNEHHELDGYVRRLAPVSEATIAELTGAGARDDLLERITDQISPARTVPARRPGRGRLALAGAAAGTVILAGAGVMALDRLSATDQESPPAAVPSSDGTAGPVPPLPGGGAESALCLYPSPATGAVFAFDGTVIETVEDVELDAFDALDPLGAVDAYQLVDFQVNEWFTDGDADRFAVVMLRSGVVGATVGAPEYGPGSRLIVAARYWDDALAPVASYCDILSYSSHDAGVVRGNFDAG